MVIYKMIKMNVIDEFVFCDIHSTKFNVTIFKG